MIAGIKVIFCSTMGKKHIQKSICEKLGMDVKTGGTTFDCHVKSMEN